MSVFVFSSPTATLTDLIAKADFSALGLSGPVGQQVLNDIAETWKSDREQGTAKLRHLIGVMNAQGAVDMLFRTWPPATDTSEPARTGFLALLSLIMRAEEPLPLLQAIGNMLVPDYTPLVTDVAAAFTTRLKNGSVAWGTIAPSGAFELVSNGELLQDGVVATIKCNAKGRLTLVSENGKKLGTWDIGDLQKEIWTKATKIRDLPHLPMTLIGADGDPPDVLVAAVYNLLTADDMVLVRSIPNTAVGLNAKDEKRIARSLLEVFAYAGKVNQLLVALAGVDLGHAGLTTGEVLRSNSMLTNLLKVFYSRYGKDFYQNALKKMVEYVDSNGDVGLGTPANCDPERVKTMVATVMNCLLSSQQYVSDQIHHLASVLKMATAARFNQEGAVYNGLSGMFLLRYVVAVLANPKLLDPGYQSKSPPDQFLMKVMLPFSRMIQTIANKQTVAGKTFGPEFEGFDNFVQTKILPDLGKFLLAVAEPPRTPAVYEAPSKERLVKRLKYIIQWLAKTKDYFPRRYSELIAQPKKGHPLSWNVQTFLLSFFNETHECKEQ